MFLSQATTLRNQPGPLRTAILALALLLLLVAVVLGSPKLI
jgi:hypothetical protein